MIEIVTHVTHTLCYTVTWKSAGGRKVSPLFWIVLHPGIGTASRRVGVRAGGFFIFGLPHSRRKAGDCGMAKGHENLIPLNRRAKDEQREIQRKGGIANGELRRKKSTIKSLLKDWADSPISNAQLKRQAESFGLDTDEGKAVLTAAILKNALKGNSKYMEYALKLLGEDSAPDDVANDGFVDAFKATAADDWGDDNV